ncbi:MAG: helix-turn-helix transcriptional regulator [Oscillospiraceae bacterium]|nr:helix-turn-helix transcriptional regulator [Oscillospiraceae bacterium]
MSPVLETKLRGTESFRFAHYHHAAPTRSISLHWHPEIEVLYGVDGTLAVTVAEETHRLRAGEILFINPDELHTFTPLTKDTHYHAAVFDLSLFRFQTPHFFEQEMITPLANGALKFPRLIDSDSPHYDTLKNAVHRLFHEDCTSNAMVFADLIVVFSTLWEHGMFTQSEHEPKSAEIKECIKYMKAHLSERISLSTLAGLVHLSPNYFCSYFKSHTGVTPFEHLHHLRLMHAARLLEHSDDAVSEIAEECGYESVSFFIRKFKEQFHCTPANYRKRTHEE